MSYTLTIDLPKEDLEIAEAQAASENTDLSKLFVAFLKDRALKSYEIAKAIRQREAVLAVAGGWRDDRTQEEIIADIEAHRTCPSTGIARHFSRFNGLVIENWFD